jgi:hypothetical protein
MQELKMAIGVMSVEQHGHVDALRFLSLAD